MIAILFVTVFAFILLLFGLNAVKHKNEEKAKETVVILDEIQEVEIIDGTSGNRVDLVEADELNEVQSILAKTEFVNASTQEDTTGYEWRIIIKTTKDTIDIISSNRVSYNGKTLRFSDDADYRKFEECIRSFYKK